MISNHFLEKHGNIKFKIPEGRIDKKKKLNEAKESLQGRLFIFKIIIRARNFTSASDRASKFKLRILSLPVLCLHRKTLLEDFCKTINKITKIMTSVLAVREISLFEF